MVASECDLPHQSQIKSSASKTQTGIHTFFWVLSEDEILAAQAKRKRANSLEEEADRAERRQREEKERNRKLAKRRNQNCAAQQKHRKKEIAADIQLGIRDTDGKLIPVG